jgi:hypothetical protein
MDEISEWLSAGSSLMEIGALSTEGIGRDDTLGFELVVTHGTTELDLTQRCHGYSSCPLSEPHKKREGIFVP